MGDNKSLTTEVVNAATAVNSEIYTAATEVNSAVEKFRTDMSSLWADEAIRNWGNDTFYPAVDEVLKNLQKNRDIFDDCLKEAGDKYLIAGQSDERVSLPAADSLPTNAHTEFATRLPGGEIGINKEESTPNEAKNSLNDFIKTVETMKNTLATSMESSIIQAFSKEDIQNTAKNSAKKIIEILKQDIELLKGIVEKKVNDAVSTYKQAQEAAKSSLDVSDASGGVQ